MQVCPLPRSDGTPVGEEQDQRSRDLTSSLSELAEELVEDGSHREAFWALVSTVYQSSGQESQVMWSMATPLRITRSVRLWPEQSLAPLLTQMFLVT